MESVFKTKFTTRGWHFYGKTQWKSPKEGQKIVCRKGK